MAAGRADATGVIVTCTSCGRANRLPFAALTKAIRCGQCKAAVGPVDSPIEIGDGATFTAAAASSTIPLLVDFWAPWCGPCRMVAPELERVARDAAGRLLVVKVNTDQVTDVAQRFAIRSIPTLAVVFKGAELGRMAGARAAADILAFAEQAIAEHARKVS